MRSAPGRGTRAPLASSPHAWADRTCPWYTAWPLVACAGAANARESLGPLFPNTCPFSTAFFDCRGRTAGATGKVGRRRPRHRQGRRGSRKAALRLFRSTNKGIASTARAITPMPWPALTGGSDNALAWHASPVRMSLWQRRPRFCRGCHRTLTIDLGLGGR